MQEPEQEKKRLRAFYRKELKALSFEKHKAQSQLVSEALKNYLQKGHHTSVGVYAPMPDEVIWHQAFDVSVQSWLFPAMTTEGMRYFRCRLDQLEERKSDFGVTIKVPPRDIELMEWPQIVIVPALCFDERGYRLGRGGGFYDRFFSVFKGIKIGICYDWQLRKEVPNLSHDQAMDVILTETRIQEISRI